MKNSACWRGEEALVGIRCLTINTRANRVVIVCSVITKIFWPYASIGLSHFNLFNKDTCDLFMLRIMLVCQLLSCIIVLIIIRLYFLPLFDFYYSFNYFCSIQLSLFIFTRKYSIMILDCIPGISILLLLKHHHLVVSPSACFMTWRILVTYIPLCLCS
jgi:hypothetical protein